MQRGDQQTSGQRRLEARGCCWVCFCAVARWPLGLDRECSAEASRGLLRILHRDALGARFPTERVRWGLESACRCSIRNIAFADALTLTHYFQLANSFFRRTSPLRVHSARTSSSNASAAFRSLPIKRALAPSAATHHRGLARHALRRDAPTLLPGDPPPTTHGRVRRAVHAAGRLLPRTLLSAVSDAWKYVSASSGFFIVRASSPRDSSRSAS